MQKPSTDVCMRGRPCPARNRAKRREIQGISVAACAASACKATGGVRKFRRGLVRAVVPAVLVAATMLVATGCGVAPGAVAASQRRLVGLHVDDAHPCPVVGKQRDQRRAQAVFDRGMRAGKEKFETSVEHR